MYSNNGYSVSQYQEFFNTKHKYYVTHINYTQKWNNNPLKINIEVLYPHPTVT